MKQTIGHITLLVKDYDEAIEFYTKKLKFNVVEDSIINESKRWVLIAPQGSKGCSLLLAKATDEAQTALIGNQTGGRVFLFLYTDNFAHAYDNIKSKGIKIIREPKKEIYGTVAVFADLYGNQWDLIEPTKRD